MFAGSFSSSVYAAAYDDELLGGAEEVVGEASNSQSDYPKFTVLRIKDFNAGSLEGRLIIKVQKHRHKARLVSRACSTIKAEGEEGKVLELNKDKSEGSVEFSDGQMISVSSKSLREFATKEGKESLAACTTSVAAGFAVGGFGAIGGGLLAATGTCAKTAYRAFREFPTVSHGAIYKALVNGDAYNVKKLNTGDLEVTITVEQLLQIVHTNALSSET